MPAMVFTGTTPSLELRTLPIPMPGPGEVRIRVSACGICRTDLHVVDSELPSPKANLIQATKSWDMHTTAYSLADANAALDDLRTGGLTGAAVLRIDQTTPA